MVAHARLCPGVNWYFFEQQLNYPITLVKYKDLNRARLSDFDVIIFPNGSYDDFPSDKLQNWVHDGGKLITIENAVAQLIDKKGFIIKKKEDKKEPVAAKKPDDEKAKQLKKLNQELAGMEKQIEALEKEVKGLEDQLADDKLYTDATKAQEVTDVDQLKKLELKEVQAKWENLAEHILELEA